MTALRLPSADGGTESWTLGEPGPWQKPSTPLTSRLAYAAAHVVPVALAENVPGAPAVVDWDRTLAYRHELWAYGLGVADAMDTAQRGMGLDWAATQELITRSGAEAAAVGGRMPALSPSGAPTTNELHLSSKCLVRVRDAPKCSTVDAWPRPSEALVNSTRPLVLLTSTAPRPPSRCGTPTTWSDWFHYAQLGAATADGTAGRTTAATRSNTGGEQRCEARLSSAYPWWASAARAARAPHSAGLSTGPSPRQQTRGRVVLPRRAHWARLAAVRRQPQCCPR